MAAPRVPVAVACEDPGGGHYPEKHRGMSEKSIRVGLIGAGANTRKHHIPGLQAQKGVEVVAVANRSPASGRKVAEAFGIPRVHDQWTALVEDADIDAVCIGTWPYMHATLTIAALEAGKHVLCEARMAMNAVEAQAMLDVSRCYPALVTQIVPSPMTLPFDRTIVEMVSEGFIGDLVSIDARISDGTFPAWDTPMHWREDRTVSGNNVMSMGIWYEAILRWFGPARSVQALGRSVVGHRRDGMGHRRAMSIPDHIEIMCEMEQGGYLRLGMSNVTGHLPPVEVYICGTEGTLRLRSTPAAQSPVRTSDVIVLEAGRRGEPGLSRVKVPKRKQGGWRVEEEFINAIRGIEPVTHTDFASALAYMEWTDAVTRAMRTGTRVALPLDASGA